MAEVLDEYARLARAKEAAEAEIAAVVEELTSGENPAGVKGPLVDAEGFPRADIDVYRARHQRHRLACLQTDHAAVMRRIEQLLPLVFEARRAQQAPSEAETPPVGSASATVPAPRATAAEDSTEEPFAVVGNVEADSPAETAGLRAGDQVLAFGSADAHNHRELAAVREIVARNVGGAVRVVVQRRRRTAPGGDGDSGGDCERLELQLTPQQWRGPGVLGCLLMPIAAART